MGRTRDINFGIGFTADTTQVDTAIAKLRQSLLSINNLQVGKDATKNFKDMSQSAQKLQMHLQNAFDANGQFNLHNFNKSLKQSGDSIKTLSSGLINGGKKGQEAFSNLASAVLSAEKPVNQLNGLAGELFNTFKNTMKWGLASSAFNHLTSTLSEAVSYAKSLNSSLTNIAIVTGQSAEEMKEFGTWANEAAKALGSTTTSVAKSAWTFYQQGDTDALAKTKTEITQKAANLSPNTDADTMATYLTSVWNGYQVSQNELESYVDVLTEVGHTTATSLEEMSAGMSKVASVANTVGVDFNQLTAIMSTVSSVTREAPETTGTAFKTIFARMQDLTLGETDEDGLQLAQVSSALKKVGIEILDSEGKLRNLGTVIEELGASWQSWDEGTKVAVAEKVAGKRQYTQLFTLMENWDEYERTLNNAANAEGTLEEKNETYMESWSAHANQLKSTVQDIYADLIDDDAVIGLLDVFTSILDKVDTFVEGIGGMKTILFTLGSVFTKVFQNQIARSLDNVAASLANVTGLTGQSYNNIKSSISDVIEKNQGKLVIDSTLLRKNQIAQGMLDIENQEAKVAKMLTEADEIQLKQRKESLKIISEQVIKDSEELENLKQQNKELVDKELKLKGVKNKSGYKAATNQMNLNSQMDSLLGTVGDFDLTNKHSVQTLYNEFHSIYNKMRGEGAAALDPLRTAINAANKEIRETGALSKDTKQSLQEAFSNTAIKQYQKDLNSVNKELEKQRQNSLNFISKDWNDAKTKVEQYKKEVETLEKSQKEQAAREKEIVKLQEQEVALQKEKSNLENIQELTSNKNNLNALKPQLTSGFYRNEDDAKKYVQNFQSQYEKFKNQVNAEKNNLKLDVDFNTKDLTKKINDIKDQVSIGEKSAIKAQYELNSISHSSDMEKLYQVAKQVNAEYDKQIQKLQEQRTSSESLEAIENKIKETQDQINNLEKQNNHVTKETVTEKKKELEQLKKEKTLYKEIKDVEEKRASLNDQIADQTKKINGNMGAMSAEIKDIEDQLKHVKMSTSQMVTALANGMFSLGSAFSSITTLPSIFSDEDLSLGEKLGQTISSLTMSITMLTMAYDSLKDVELAELATKLKQIPTILSEIAANKLHLFSTEEQLKAYQDQVKSEYELADAEADSAKQEQEYREEILKTTQATEEAIKVRLEATKAWSGSTPEDIKKAEKDYKQAQTDTQDAQDLVDENTPLMEEAQNRLEDIKGEFDLSKIREVGVKDWSKNLAGKVLDSSKSILTKAWPLLIAYAGVKIIKGIANLGEKANEAYEEQKEIYDNAKQDLENVESELESKQQEISDLESQNELTTTEQQKLATLKQERAELEQQKILQEEEVKREALAAAASAKHALDMEKVSRPLLKIWQGIKDVFLDIKETFVDVAEDLYDFFEPIIDFLNDLSGGAVFGENGITSGGNIYENADLDTHTVGEITEALEEYVAATGDTEKQAEALVKAYEAIGDAQAEAAENLESTESKIESLETAKNDYGLDIYDSQLEELYDTRQAERIAAYGNAGYQEAFITPVLDSDGIVAYQDEIAELIWNSAKTGEEISLSSFDNIASGLSNTLSTALEQNNISFDEWLAGLQSNFGGAAANLENQLAGAIGVSNSELNKSVKMQAVIVAATQDLNFEQAGYLQQLEFTNEDIDYINDNLNDSSAILELIQNKLLEIESAANTFTDADRYNMLEQALNEIIEAGTVSDATIEEMKDMGLDIDLSGSVIEDIDAIADWQKAYNQAEYEIEMASVAHWDKERQKATETTTAIAEEEKKKNEEVIEDKKQKEDQLQQDLINGAKDIKWTEENNEVVQKLVVDSKEAEQEIRQFEDNSHYAPIKGSAIKIEADTSDVKEKLDDVEEDVQYIVAGHNIIEIDANADKAKSKTQKVQEEVDKLTDDTNEIDIEVSNSTQKNISKAAKKLTDKIEKIPGVTDAIELEFEIKNAKTIASQAKAIAKGIELIGDDYTVAYDDLETFRQLFPKLAAAHTEYTEDGLKLDQTAIESIRNVASETIDADAAATTAELDNDILEAQSQLETVDNAITLVEAQSDATIDFTDKSGKVQQAVLAALSVARSEYALEAIYDSEESNSEESENVQEYANSAYTSLSNSLVDWNTYWSKVCESTDTACQKISDATEDAVNGGSYSGMSTTSISTLMGSQSGGTSTYNSGMEDFEKDSRESTEAISWASSETGWKGSNAASEAFAAAQALIDEANAGATVQKDKVLAVLEEARSNITTNLTTLQSLRDQIGEYQAKNKATLNQDSGSSSGSDSEDEQELAELLEEEVERYHEINEQIEYQEELCSRLEQARDRLYGANYLNNLQQEIDAQQEYVDLLNDRMVLYEAMLASDKIAAEEVGAIFDDNGLITNYTELLNAKEEDINSRIEGLDSDDEMVETIKEEYEDLQEILDQYEESVNINNEAISELQEAIYTLQDLTAEAIDTENEMQQTAYDNTMSIYDLWADLYDDWDEAGKQAAVYIDELQAVYDRADEIENRMAEIESSYLGGGMSEADYEEAIEELNDNLEDTISTMMELQESMEELISTAIDGASEELEKYFNVYSNMITEIQYYIDTFSKIAARDSHGFAASAYNNQAQVYQSQIDAQGQYLEALKDAQSNWEEYSEEWFQYETAIEEAKESIIDLTSSALEALGNAFEEQLQAAIQEFNDAIGIINMSSFSEQYGRLAEEQERYLDYADKLYETSKLQRELDESINDADSTAAKQRLKSLQSEIDALEEKDNVSQYEIDYLQKKYELTLKQNALDQANEQKSLRLTRSDNGDMVYTFTSDLEEVSKAEQEYEDAMKALKDLSEDQVAEMGENFASHLQEYEEAIANFDYSMYETAEEAEAALQEITSYYNDLLLYDKEQYMLAQANLATDTSNLIMELSEEETNVKIALAKREYNAIMGIIDEENDAIINGISSTTNYAGNSAETLEKLIEGTSSYARTSTIEAVNAITSVMDALTDSYGSTEGKINLLEKTTQSIMDAWDEWNDSSNTIATEGLKAVDDELGSIWEEMNKKEYDEDGNLKSTAIKDALDAIADGVNTLTTENLSDLNTAISTTTTTISSLLSAINTAIEEWNNNWKDEYVIKHIVALEESEEVDSGQTVTQYYGDDEASEMKNAARAYAEGEVNILTAINSLDEHAANRNAKLQAYEDNGINTTYTQAATNTAQQVLKDAMIDIENNDGDWKTKNFDGSDATDETQLKLNYFNDKLKKAGVLDEFSTFDTGGYTGDWGTTDGKLAILHEKEIVLNQDDTSNILQAVGIMRTLLENKALNAAATGINSGLSVTSAANTTSNVDNSTNTFHVEFPNATQHSEIEQAINDLIAHSDQYRGRYIN